MRWLAAMPIALLLGCHGEPSFDERYDAADKKIHDTAADIDSQLAAHETDKPLSRGASSASAAAGDKGRHNFPDGL